MSLSFKQKIRNREIVFGSHVSLADPTSAEIFGYAGLDFVWIDTEHSPLDYGTLQNLIGALKISGTPCVVRVGVDTPWHVKKVLEMGPDGLVFPMISNVAEARKAMGSCLYPPRGYRGFAPRRAVRYGFDNVSDYIGRINDELCKCVQIETREALDNLPELVKEPEIDCFIFGPCDLSFSLGYPNQPRGEVTLKEIRQAIEIIRPSGKSIGISTGADDEESVRFWKDMGINFISCGADYVYLVRGIKAYKSVTEKIRAER